MPLFPAVGRTQPHLRISWWAMVALLCTGIFLHLFPFYFMIISSFKDGAEILQPIPTLWPQHPTLAAWKLVLFVTEGGLLPEPFWIYFRNSLVQAAGALLLSIPVTSFAAYAVSKLLPGRSARWLFLFFISTLMIPSVVSLLPSLLLTINFPFAVPSGSVPTLPNGDPFPTIQIWDTVWAVIIPSGFNAFNFLYFKGYFDSLPNSVLQAARVDGGSELNIFRRIVLPMSIPVFAIMIWGQFGAIWDGSFLWASLVFRSPDEIPASVAIYNLINLFQANGLTGISAQASQQHALQMGLTYNGLIVLGLLQTFPTFVMFILCREYMLKGIRIRGLK